jgi:hypothetical protein
MLDHVIIEARSCAEKIMVNSRNGEKFVATGGDPQELMPPTFASDLAPNIRLVLIARAILFFGVMPH